MKNLLISLIIVLFTISAGAIYLRKTSEIGVLRYKLEGEGKHIIGINNPEKLDTIIIEIEVICKKKFIQL